MYILLGTLIYKSKYTFVRRIYMLRYVMIFLFGIFIIYIFVCTYKYKRCGITNKVILQFMTYCMILFTFTIVYYKDVLIKENYGIHREISARNDSKVFLSSFDNEPWDNNDVYEKANKQGMKISAYFDNANPARGSITNLHVTGPVGGKVTAICQYKGHGTPYMMDIGKNGIAVIPVMVENGAEPGVLVVVDIEVSFEGRKYKANTVFTPK